MFLGQRLSTVYNSAVHKVVFAKDEKLTATEKVVYHGANALETASGLVYLGYMIARIPFVAAGALIGAGVALARPVSSYDHPPYSDLPSGGLAKPPYWQDIIFGEGRAERLLERLQGEPTVSKLTQEALLNYSLGGLTALPAHKSLIKYGLNDDKIIGAFYSLRSFIEDVAENQKQECNLVRLGRDGAVSGDGTILCSRDDLVRQIYLTLREDGMSSESQRTVAQLYDWIVQDVAPAVPASFEGYETKAGDDGLLTLTKTARRRYDEMPKPLFELLIAGYKGAVPNRDHAPPATTPPTPA